MSSCPSFSGSLPPFSPRSLHSPPLSLSATHSRSRSPHSASSPPFLFLLQYPFLFHWVSPSLAPTFRTWAWTLPTLPAPPPSLSPEWRRLWSPGSPGPRCSALSTLASASLPHLLPPSHGYPRLLGSPGLSPSSLSGFYLPLALLPLGFGCGSWSLPPP